MLEEVVSSAETVEFEFSEVVNESIKRACGALEHDFHVMVQTQSSLPLQYNMYELKPNTMFDSMVYSSVS